VTERCVMRLEPEGVTVTEIAPGIDLKRDILAQAEFPLRIANDCRKMDPALYRPDRLNLQLRPARERLQ
jgi:propionate CoA-transferase